MQMDTYRIVYDSGFARKQQSLAFRQGFDWIQKVSATYSLRNNLLNVSPLPVNFT